MAFGMTVLLSASLCLAAGTKYELHPYDPVAAPEAVITYDLGRFTVLTSRLVRMEYDPMQRFENRPTLSVVNRNLPVPAFRSVVLSDGLFIVTEDIQLHYRGGLFAPPSLRVQMPHGGATEFEAWVHGMTSGEDIKNLRGTFRTLDMVSNVSLDCNTNGAEHCAWGLVSRKGWALVDDTATPVLGDDDWWTNISGGLLRNHNAQDLYLFAHGSDYAGALQDYVSIAGRTMLPPRYSLGVWFTRWYDYSAEDVEEVVSAFDRSGLPLDVFVFDMNWHTKWDWTGYSWDTQLLPYPRDTTAYLHGKGVAVAANLHDATGIGRWETSYKRFCEAIGVDSEHPPDGDRVKLDLTNRTRVWALEDEVLLPVEEDGVDFWWIDWQQGEAAAGTGQDGPERRMNPTVWLNKLRATDGLRRCARGLECPGKRNLVLGRWGGLGSHRYPVGFSGDVSGLTWANMAYQAYFSATAANVAYGLWSHDVVAPGDDLDLYVRWVQLTAFSAVMRMHDRGLSAGACFRAFPTLQSDCPIVEPYKLPAMYLDAVRAALRLRALLVPYTYTAMRLATATGGALVRPMYWDFPGEEAAYPSTMDEDLGQHPSTSQYMFGPSILVAPVTRPPKPRAGSCGAAARRGRPDEPCALTPVQVWVPPGLWVEHHSGRTVRGPSNVSLRVHLGEMPLYVRAGAILPMLSAPEGRSMVGISARAYAALELTVFPGARTGQQLIYEDDGISTAYAQGGPNSQAWTEVSYKRLVVAGGGESATSTANWNDQPTRAARLNPAGAASSNRTNETVVVSVATTGFFEGMEVRRDYTLRLRNALPPTAVHAFQHAKGGDCSLTGCRKHAPLAPVQPRAVGLQGASWWFDGSVVDLLVHFPNASTEQALCVCVEHGPGPDPAGVRGLAARAILAKRNLDETRSVRCGSRDKCAERYRPAPTTSALIRLSTVPGKLTHLAVHAPDVFAHEVREVFESLHAESIAELKGMADRAAGPDAKARIGYSLDIMESA